jgi:flagellar biosynthesis/type III secretory pathway M-ring protein FliF/YscJ
VPEIFQAIVFVVLIAVAVLALGIGFGIVMAPRIGRLAERADADEGDEEARD